MTYMGHVENGAIVLDDPVVLPDGVSVKIEFAGELPKANVRTVESLKMETARFPLRGLAYRYDAPLEPAVSEQEWAANS
jgi:hypothetical protein